ncbi:MAG: DUF1549 and DUF1553 domain-containing protein, partial [Candidatus Acidiferrum sp.]
MANGLMVVLLASVCTLRAPASAADKSAKHWAYQPLLIPKIPVVKRQAWVKTPVDAFILAKLEASGMQPSGPADRRILLRRVSFDLIGLPPTPEEMDAFLADQSADAYEKQVDRLLASPRYGERWARHWMDVIHFAETHGNDQDSPREHAWPYRDYLIQSFNQNKPYARFAAEQIAGDVLFPGRPEGIIATGFLAAGPWDESSQKDIRDDTIDKKIAQNLDRDDMVTTTMSTFVSATVHCARCHNHKFDPITQVEYYGLQAVFAGVDRADREFESDPAAAPKRQALLKRQAELIPKLLLLAASNPLAAAHLIVGKFAIQLRDVNAKLAALPPRRIVYAATSDFRAVGSFKPARGCRPVHVLRRGDMHNPGPMAAPGALVCVRGLSARFDLKNSANEGERRAALARWITASANVLTWRSIVNRVWHYHFGRGIVATPNDLGHMGGIPSHPELLDWLAITFRDGGGSLKKLHRLIVTSAVYRQSSRNNREYAKLDADNTLLWRMNRSRLDAESLRDAVLLVSGKLDLTMGGPSVKQFTQKPGIHVTPNINYLNYNLDGAGAYRRSIYRFLFRTLPDPFMEALDCPDASTLTPVRASSVTALQALALLNDRFIIRQAEHFAARLSRAGNVQNQVKAA